MNTKNEIIRSLKELIHETNCFDKVKTLGSTVPGRLIFRLRNTEFYLSWDSRDWYWYHMRRSAYADQVSFEEVLSSGADFPEEILFHLDTFISLEELTRKRIREIRELWEVMGKW